MSKNNEESIIEVKDLSKSFGDHLYPWFVRFR